LVLRGGPNIHCGARVALMQDQHLVRDIENVWITMSDGCRLAARIWMPAERRRCLAREYADHRTPPFAQASNLLTVSPGQPSRVARATHASHPYGE
jgi:hypothetical protein